MRLLGLADALHDEGLPVVEIDGWKARGSASFNPRGTVNHHTAGAARGDHPSLNVCIHGRAGIPGPLCHTLRGRNGVFYVLASGRANHAGTGGWNGLSGNSSVVGLELEHVGTSAEPVTAQLIEDAERWHAAVLRLIGAPASMACQHREWAPRRKIDAYGFDGPTFRRHIAVLLAQQSHRPSPPTDGELDMTEDDLRRIVAEEINRALAALVKVIDSEGAERDQFVAKWTKAMSDLTVERVQGD